MVRTGETFEFLRQDDAKKPVFRQGKVEPCEVDLEIREKEKKLPEPD